MLKKPGLSKPLHNISLQTAEALFETPSDRIGLVRAAVVDGDNPSANEQDTSNLTNSVTNVTTTGSYLSPNRSIFLSTPEEEEERNN